MDGESGQNIENGTQSPVLETVEDGKDKTLIVQEKAI
jgi:hypothetical protein